MKGFGLNFYGFFLFAALWICAYAFWVRYINAREKSAQYHGTQRVDLITLNKK